jgi:hypothetical protein
MKNHIFIEKIIPVIEKIENISSIMHGFMAIYEHASVNSSLNHYRSLCKLNSVIQQRINSTLKESLTIVKHISDIRSYDK